MLAPIEDYSDSTLRALCFTHGCDLTFTEMARVEGIVRNNKPTLAKTLCCDSTPVQIQLLASNEEQLEKYLTNFKTFEGFEGFNLNMSCPSADIMKAGRGAGMVKRLTRAQSLVNIIKKHNYPVSIKLRLGMNQAEQDYKVYLRLIEGTNADFYIVHAKHGMQRSDEPAQENSVYVACVEAAKKNGKIIIANGDLNSATKIREVQKTGVQGVMIARGALRNPSIFDSLKNELNFNSPNKKLPTVKELRKEYLDLANKFASPPKYRDNLLKWMMQ